MYKVDVEEQFSFVVRSRQQRERERVCGEVSCVCFVQILLPLHPE